jgi:hypothetical protein
MYITNYSYIIINVLLCYKLFIRMSPFGHCLTTGTLVHIHLTFPFISVHITDKLYIFRQNKT